MSSQGLINWNCIGFMSPLSLMYWGSISGFSVPSLPLPQREAMVERLTVFCLWIYILWFSFFFCFLIMASECSSQGSSSILLPFLIHCVSLLGFHLSIDSIWMASVTINPFILGVFEEPHFHLELTFPPKGFSSNEQVFTQHCWAGWKDGHRSSWERSWLSWKYTGLYKLSLETRCSIIQGLVMW